MSAKPYKKFFIRNIPLYVLILISAITSFLFFGLYAEYIKNERSLDINNIIYADVKYIERIPHGATSHGYSKFYDVYFEYSDGDFVYKGSITADAEAAESYLEKDIKIPIYIDGKGHCVAVAEYNERIENGLADKALIIGIVSLILFCLFVGIAALLFLKQRKKIKNIRSD